MYPPKNSQFPFTGREQMNRAYEVIDADGHILEPGDLWHEGIDRRYRDQAPRVVIDTDGKERFLVDGRLIGNVTFGLSSAGGCGIPIEDFHKMKYADGRKGGFDPHARVKDLDIDGIDAVVLYPTLGLFTGAIADSGLAAAVCRTYNRWIADFCKTHPDRLIGVAMLPMQSVDHAVEELKYARNTLGLRSAFLRPNPYNNRLLSDADYDPIWATAQDLDVSIALHEGTGGMPAVGGDRVRGFGARHIVSHTMEMQFASLNIIWGGVCERFPKLRFGFLECGGGWMPAWLDRMDRHFDRKGGFWEEISLSMRPSDYFRRQCWISFEPVEGTIAFAAEYLGANRLLWATDYPHVDGYFPGAPQMIANRLPEGMRRQVLAQGAVDFYQLN